MTGAAVGGSERVLIALLFFSLLVAGGLAGSPGADAAADSRTNPNVTPIPDQYIVVLEDSVAHPGVVAETQADSHRGDLGFVYRHGLKGYSAELSKAAVDDLRNNPKVDYVVPNQRIELATLSQETPTGTERIGAAQNVTADIDAQDDARVNVDVAVIDTGVDAGHPDLNVYHRANCVPPKEGFESVAELEAEECAENSGSDAIGHGTHVAGIVGAIDNGAGVVGAAPGARIWAVRVFAKDGYTPGIEKDGVVTTAWWIAGVDYVTAHASEIEVANMSLGCFGGKSKPCVLKPLEDAIEASIDSGVVYVVAAGNQSVDAALVSPARVPSVVTVSALADYDGKPGGEAEPRKFYDCTAVDASLVQNNGADDTLALFSNWGSGVDLAAPGVCIRSTLPVAGSAYGKEYGYLSGTSMAAPQVAGAAALLASKSNPNSRGGVEAITAQLKDEASQDWNDIWRLGPAEPGVEYSVGGLKSEEAQDSTQEPLLDERPQGGSVYATRATERHYREVTLNGGLNPNGIATTFQFEYGPTTAYGSKAPASPQAAGSGSKDLRISKTVSGLKTNTLYHYRLAATTAGGTVYGKDRTFIPAKSFIMLEPTQLEASSAKLQASINPAGLATTIQYEYGPTAAYGSKAPAPPLSIGSGTTLQKRQVLVEGLKPETQYHYRLVVSNETGTFYGEDKVITTGPVAVTKEATGIDARRARLEARVDPIGLATTYWFEWGPTKAYGGKVPASPKSVGSGVNAVSVGDLAEGLKPNTTYHYRVVASNSAGTFHGPDVAFTTADVEFELAGGGSGAAISVAGGSFDFATRWGNFDYTDGGANLISCSNPPLAGELSRVESLTLQAGNTLCTTNFGTEYGVEQTLKANGCHFVLHPGRESNDAGVYRGSVDIGGSSCTGPNIRYADKAGNTHCEITISPQRNLAASFSEYAVTGKPGQVLVDIRDYLSYSQNGLLCIDGSFDDGSLWADFRLQGSKGGGTPTDLHLRKASQTAVTKPPTAVAETKATLNGIVSPGGLATTYWFQYVGSSGYDEDAADPYAAGSKAPVTPASAGSGSGAVAVSQTVEGLPVHASYHYRLVAENSEGITYGKDQTLTTTPEYLGSFGSSGSGPGQLSSPQGVAAGPEGHVWVADKGNDRVVEFDAEGEYLGQLGGSGSGAGQMNEPMDVAIADNGDLWVLDSGNLRVQRFNAAGQFQSQFGRAGLKAGEFSDPVGIALTPEGNVVVTDLDVGVAEFTSSGGYIRLLESFYYSPHGIGVDDQGRFWWTEPNDHRARVTDSNGVQRFMFGAGVGTKEPLGDPNICLEVPQEVCESGVKGTAPGQLETPKPLEVSPLNTAFIADASGRVQEFDSSGHYMTQFGGSSQLGQAAGIATGPGGGIYATDAANDRLQAWCMPVAAGARTAAATGLSPLKATLAGGVNPGCLPTTYQFEYGITAAYGSKVPASPQSVGSGAEEVPVSQQLEGLAPHATYHYRVVATNEKGTAYGEDMTFTTPSRHVTRLEAESHPASVSGSQSPSAKHLLTFASRSFECGNATLIASLAAPAPKTALQASYANCEAVVLGGKYPATVQMNGCSWGIELANSATSPYAAKLGVACAKEGEAIEARVFADAGKQAKGESVCTYKVAPQAASEGVSLTNSGSGSGRQVTLSLNLKALPYTRTQGTIASCGGASGSATYTGASSLSAAGQGLYVSPGEATTGVFLSGSQSSEPAKQPRVEAESYPLALAGEQGGAHVLGFAGRSVECFQAYLDGTLAAAASQLTLQTSYGGCQAVVLNGKYPATVQAGACSWQLQVQNAGPPYTGSLGLACAQEGEGIEARVYENAEKQAKGESFCTYRIAPQGGAPGVSLSNSGSGSARAVSTSFALSGLAYTRTQGTIASCGGASGSAAYAGATVLRGFK